MSTTTAVHVATLILVTTVSVARAGEDGDPRDEALAVFMTEVTASILAAAQGQPVDPRWNAVGEPGESLADTDAETLAAVKALGGPLEVLFTALEIEAVGRNPDGAMYVRSNCAVFPDGRVLWLDATARPGDTYVSETPALREAAPALAGAVDRAVAALIDPACSLPLVTAEDLSALPEEIRLESARETGEVKQACGAMRGFDAGWTPRVDDVSVLVRSGAQVAVLRTAFEVVEGRIRLYQVRFRPLQ